MSEQENIKAAHSFFEAWNANDLSKAAPYEADGFVVEAPGSPAPMNSAQNRAYNQNFLSAFPGSKFEVLLDVVQGDYVVTHWRVSGGKHSGTLYSPSGTPIPPTGKAATVVGSSTFLIKNGKIVHGWTFWDMASLLSQLGLLPPM
jgi:predicted ester cyclase